jgi:maleate cis-trans isomerase
VQTLEERLGKPVVTSHAATLWRVLALAGIDTPNRAITSFTLVGSSCDFTL